LISPSELQSRCRGHLRVAEMALKSGDYHAALRNIEAAFQEMEMARTIFDGIDLHRLYHLAGKIYTCTQRYRQAELAFRAASELARQLLRGSDRWSDTRHLAEVYRLQGKLSEAHSLYQQCINGLQESGDKAAAAKSLMGAADVELDSGNLDGAETLVRSALDLFEWNLGSRSYWYGRCLLKLARLRFLQGKRSECQELLDRARDILEPLIGPHHPLRALVLDKLARCLQETGDGEQAEECLAEVRTIGRYLATYDV